MGLSDKKCTPCEAGTPPFSRDEVKGRLKDVPGWDVNDKGRLTRSFKLDTFTNAVARLNKVADIAEREGHHPDVCVMGYNTLKVSLWTHASKGLTENDFIVAAKINLELERQAMPAISK